MSDFWEIAVGIAGIGAIVSLVFLLLYKQFLKLPIFQKLTKRQQFLLFRLFLILVFLFSISGLIIYAFVNSGQNKVELDSLVLVIDSDSRKIVKDDIQTLLLKHIKKIEVQRPAIDGDWMNTVAAITSRQHKPDIVIAHFHALRGRGIGKYEHLESEEKLLKGLSMINSSIENVWFVIYSSKFSPNKTKNLKSIREAADRFCKTKPGERKNMDNLFDRIKTIRWSLQPSSDDKTALIDTVKSFIKSG